MVEGEGEDKHHGFEIATLSDQIFNSIPSIPMAYTHDIQVNEESILSNSSGLGGTWNMIKNEHFYLFSYFSTACCAWKQPVS